ncbi:hypothetical protein HPP92_026284 [Vanilla planifolia]|uniref:F-box domain-containing protein n=2 Tax=Vanilla planifolia TaxID=51239 RepID=A0A835PK80_VANPL|nr:hypothetical protein HPP92_026284 [Vanilla planifolia]
MTKQWYNCNFVFPSSPSSSDARGGKMARNLLISPASFHSSTIFALTTSFPHTVTSSPKTKILIPMIPSTSTSVLRRGPAKKRGNYNCGRCGLPKKGHVCPSSSTRTTPTPPRSEHRLRRALSFDEDVAESPLTVLSLELAEEEEEEGEEEMVEVGAGLALPVTCLAMVLMRLTPKELIGAALVNRGWRDCVRMMWISAEEIRVRVSQIRFVGSVFHKCSGLLRLSLIMESDADSTLLACVAFSCPNLEYLEISLAKNAVNRITGDELGRFVAEKRSLSVLKVEGCYNIGFLNISSSSLSNLWLSNLYCISRMVAYCPNLEELSLDFAQQDHDSTDLVSMMDCLGISCPSLRKMHIASVQLCNDVVRALVDANLRDLRMLSLVLGSRISDASVAAIISSYTHLELLDLSGSSITDNGVGMICNAFHRTLSKLLLALCPNITSSGIQLAMAQLPLLLLMDCGMSICDEKCTEFGLEDSMVQLNEKATESKRYQCSPAKKKKPVHQKLIIQHGRLKKLSLWGCSALDGLYLKCPELDDLNLNSCINLHPEKLLLQCPSLRTVHACGCHDMLIGAIKNQACISSSYFDFLVEFMPEKLGDYITDLNNDEQNFYKRRNIDMHFKVLNEFSSAENHCSLKRLADGSKRVHVPRIHPQPCEDEKRKVSARIINLPI